MALVVSRPKAFAAPDQGLRQAIVEFEHALTDDQKLVLRAADPDKPPDTAAVFSLCSDIDERRNHQHGPCVGTRLSTFLQSVQQFSAIVDTFVSSKPGTAALVWGGVKLALLAATNYADYIVRLSSLFMDLRTSLPLFAEFENLYPGSVRLQRALCNYYAEVVRLCRRMLDFSTRSDLSQFSSTVFRLFETEFGPVCAAIRKRGSEVGEEISLAFQQAQRDEAKLQQLERTEAARSRKKVFDFHKSLTKETDDARQWRKDTEIRRKKARRARALSLLSIFDYETAWKQARKLRSNGTCNWVFTNSGYEGWRSFAGSSTLWLSGILGSGKTVLMATIIANVLKQTPDSHNVSYFFCRHDDPESLKAPTILGSILRQFLNDSSLDVDALVDSLSRSRRTIDGFIDILERILSGSKQYFIIIDGVDECAAGDQTDLLSALRALLNISRFQIQLLLSGRPNIARQIENYLHPAFITSMDCADHCADIMSFIDISISQKLQNGDLALGDPTIRAELQSALEAGAHGMFLWVALMIDDICMEESDADIRAALQNLPTDLSMLFQRVLRRITTRGERQMKTARRIFQWIAIAKRPLLLEELKEAIAVERDQTTLQPSQLKTDMIRVVSHCGSLAVVDPEDYTVHFAHQSVRQFLCSPAQAPELEILLVNLAAADKEAGITCLTYLSFNDFRKQVEKVPERPAEISKEYTSALLEYSNPLTASKIGRFAMKLTGLDDNARIDIHSTLQNAVVSAQTLKKPQAPSHAFLNYARKYWLYHATELAKDVQDPKFRLFCRFLGEDHLEIERPWTASDWWEGDNDLLRILANDDHIPALLGFLRGRDPRSGDTLKILQLARNRSQFKVLMLLLSSSSFSEGAGVEEAFLTEPEVCESVLELAQEGNFHFFQNCPPGLRHLEGRTTLAKSIILKRPVNALFVFRDPRDRDILAQLSSDDYLDQRSSNQPVNVFRGSLDCQALNQAYRRALVQISNASMNPLEVAAMNGSPLVNFLLKDEDECGPNVYRRTSLAFIYGACSSTPSQQLFSTLINSRSVDINSATEDGVTTLMVLAANGSTGEMTEMLEKGADAWARACNGWNALLIAAALGQERAMRVLTAKGSTRVGVGHTDTVISYPKSDMFYVKNFSRKFSEMYADRLSWRFAERELARWVLRRR